MTMIATRLKKVALALLLITILIGCDVGQSPDIITRVRIDNSTSAMVVKSGGRYCWDSDMSVHAPIFNLIGFPLRQGARLESSNVQGECLFELWSNDGVDFENKLQNKGALTIWSESTYINRSGGYRKKQTGRGGVFLREHEAKAFFERNIAPGRGTIERQNMVLSDWPLEIATFREPDNTWSALGQVKKPLQMRGGREIYLIMAYTDASSREEALEFVKARMSHHQPPKN